MCLWDTDAPSWQTGSRQMRDLNKGRHGTASPHNALD